MKVCTKRGREAIFIMLCIATPAAYADGLAGVARYGGKPVTPAVINKGAPPACGSDPVLDESIVTADGKLANVVITVEGPGLDKKAPRDLVLDQHGCRYLPHVQTAQVGSKLTIENADSALHTAHGYLGDASLFNVATPAAGSKVQRALDSVGTIKMKCDAGHTWMSAWIVVTDNAYDAVSGADGAFAIPDLPPGAYTVKAWHETLGTRTAKVTVKPGKPATVGFDFK